MNIEEAIVKEDSDFLIKILEKAMSDAEFEEEFLEKFHELPKCLQVDIITMGLTKIINSWHPFLGYGGLN